MRSLVTIICFGYFACIMTIRPWKGTSQLLVLLVPFSFLILGLGFWNNSKLQFPFTTKYLHPTFFENNTWLLVCAFLYDFYEFFLMVCHVLVPDSRLPEWLRTTATTDTIHETVLDRGCNYVFILLLYFCIMRVAFPNPGPANFWFACFVIVRFYLTYRIAMQEIIFGALGGGEAAEHGSGNNSRAQIRYISIIYNAFCALVFPFIILIHVSYKYARQIKIEFQLLRYGELQVQHLKKVTRHLTEASKSKLARINDFNKMLQETSFQRIFTVTDGNSKLVTYFCEEAYTTQNLYMRLENVCMVLRRYGDILSSMNEHGHEENQSQEGHGSGSENQEFMIFYPLEALPRWYAPFHMSHSNDILNVSITLEVEPDLKCIRIQADILQLIVIRSLSSICARRHSSVSGAKETLEVIIRISSLEMHMQLHPEDRGRIFCDDGGNMHYADHSTMQNPFFISVHDQHRGSPANKAHNHFFVGKRKLVIEISHGSAERQMFINRDDNVDTGNTNQYPKNSSTTEEFLWKACKLVMNRGSISRRKTSEVSLLQIFIFTALLT